MTGIGENTISRIDIHTASLARMYDWLAGGIDNYPVDRDACARLLEAAPGLQAVVRGQRDFQIRVVEALASDEGITQFIVLGCGLPGEELIHQSAQRRAPGARVIYADRDPLAISQARTVLDENDDIGIIDADLRDPAAVLSHPETERLIDFSQPALVLCTSVLHCLPDDENPAAWVRMLTGRLASGSYLALSQLASSSTAIRSRTDHLMSRALPGRWGAVRAPHDVEAFFMGLEVISPGLGDIRLWPHDAASQYAAGVPALVEWGGLGRVPVNRQPAPDDDTCAASPRASTCSPDVNRPPH